MEVEKAIDRVLPVFNSQTQMRAYKRELQQLEDLGSKWHAKAMRDETPENAHVCARLNERVCAMRGWSSVNVRLDPYSAQTEQQPSRFEKLHLKHGDDWTPPSDGNGAALAPPAEAPADDQNGCRTKFLNPSTISSITAATLGTRSSISRGKSCPSRARDWAAAGYSI
jgi:hypothetical protein